MPLFTRFLPKEINAKFCPKCGSHDVHRSFKGSAKANILGLLLAPGLKCFGCGYASLLFPEKKVRIKK